MVLNTQESMFVIGAIADLIVIIKVAKTFTTTLSGLQQTQHLNVNDDDGSGEHDKIVYHKISTVDNDQI